MRITEINDPGIAHPAGTYGRPQRTSPDNLVGRLNLEWARLSEAPTSTAAVAGWEAASPALRGAESLENVLSRIQQADVTARDEVLLALLELSHAGDQLAGRTVLQAMLGKAVRVTASAATRPDVRGDQEEALACAVSSLWLVIATYPITRRRSRVAANLALDTVALVQRGHTHRQQPLPPHLPRDPIRRRPGSRRVRPPNTWNRKTFTDRRTPSCSACSRGRCATAS